MGEAIRGAFGCEVVGKMGSGWLVVIGCSGDICNDYASARTLTMSGFFTCELYRVCLTVILAWIGYRVIQAFEKIQHS